MELVLHIGMPKTGTTAIQMAFHRARTALERQGVLYPDLGVLSHAHHALMPLFRDRAEWWSLVAKGLAGRDARQWADAAWDGLVAQAREAKAKQVVLSTEALFVPLDPEMRDAFVARIRDAFPSVRVVAYVRDPALYYRSILLERAKRSLVPPNATDFQYRVPIEQFETGLDLRADIRPYSQETLKDGDAVADFCDRFLEIETRPETVRSNRSPRPETLEIYQAIMSHTMDARNWTTDWDLLVRLKAIETEVGEPEDRAAIRPDVSKWITRRHADDIGWLTEREIPVRPAPKSKAARPRIRALRDAFEMDRDFQAVLLRAVEDQAGLPPGTQYRLREIRKDADTLIRRLRKRPPA